MANAAQAPVELGENLFLRKLIRHLSGTLQDVIGMEDAEGFISLVGQKMGDEINASYRQALGLTSLTRPQVAEVLVDLKRRIDGDFFVIEESDEKIVLGNRRCPFGKMVEGRPSLCMMTSNVFGAIAADNLGYAKVHLARTIAEGHSGCEVVIHLSDSEQARQQKGREYFALPDD